ncbi:MAG TPA: hypothetical protein VJX67_15490 [Blastocatellia bacterium]|nr:hypothetical protein [Blastocatellia bacterium]
MLKLLRRNRTLVVAVTAVISLAGLGLSVSRSASTVEQLTAVNSVALTGVSSANQVGLSPDGKYSLVAPFWPSAVGATDNHYAFVTKLASPGSGPFPLNLQDAQGNWSYVYPGTLAVNAATSGGGVNQAFIRTTKVSSDPSIQAAPIEGLSFFSFSTNQKKPRIVTQNGVEFIPIDPVGSTPGSGAFSAAASISPDDRSYTPSDFGLGKNGTTLVDSNGASFTVVALDKGTQYPVALMSDYSPLVGPDDGVTPFHEVTYLGVDQATSTVLVTVNGRDQLGSNFSELYFYKLHEDPADPAYATVDLLKYVRLDEGAGAASMTPGSNAVVTPDGKWGYFALSDGSLVRVALDGNLASTKLESLGQYSAIAAQDPLNRGPRTVVFSGDYRSIGIAKRGHRLRSRRPAGIARTGALNRPAVSAIFESPGAVVVGLAKDGTVASVDSFMFEAESSISNIVFDPSGLPTVAGGDSGSLLCLTPDGVVSLGATPVGIRSLMLDSTRSSLLGISSDESANGTGDPGSDPSGPVTGALVIMKLRQSASGTGYGVSSMVTGTVSLLGGIAGNTRLPILGGN